MNIDNIILENFVFLLLLSFLNYMFLREPFRRLKINPENQSAIKKFKRKWSLIFFTDILFYFAVYYLILLIISNNFSVDFKRNSVLAFIISLVITGFYMQYFHFLLQKCAIFAFGSNYIKEGDIAKPEKVEYKVNDKNNYNETYYENSDRSNKMPGETRKLTINRMKAFVGYIIKIYIFIETDNTCTVGKVLNLNGKHFIQMGAIPNGKALNAYIPVRPVEILFATATFNNLYLYSHYSVLSGDDEIILNVKMRQYNTSSISFEVERIK